MPLIRVLAIITLSNLANGCRSTSSKPMAVEATVGASLGDHLRWLGYAKAREAHSKIPVILDLARIQSTGNISKYRGIMRLSLGGFAGHEYDTLYFSDISHDAVKGSLSFAGGPENVAITSASANEQLLSAEIKIADKGRELSLEMKPEREMLAQDAAALIFADLPVTPPLTGVYQANCPGQFTEIQIEASKWRKKIGDKPFSDIRISGRSGKPEPEVCGADRVCVKESFAVGSIDPVAGLVSLGNNSLSRHCSLKSNQLICDGCVATYDPISDYSLLIGSDSYRRHPRLAHVLPKADSDYDSDLPSVGEYYGFLHHETTNAYQLVALDLRPAASLHAATTQAIGLGQKLSAVGTLYFGEGDSNEFISYHFKPSAWEGRAPLILDSNGEAFIVVDSWKDGILSGYWYAKSFGRVGSIELQISTVPSLPRGSHLMNRVSGRYKDKDSEFEVMTTANISEDPNDFYPLKVTGWARDPDEKTRRRNIVDGSFDFYSNAFALRLDDGRTILGRSSDGAISIHWPPRSRYGAPMVGKVQQFKFQP